MSRNVSQNWLSKRMMGRGRRDLLKMFSEACLLLTERTWGSMDWGLTVLSFIMGA